MQETTRSSSWKSPRPRCGRWRDRHRILSSRGVVFQSRSTSNVSTHLDTTSKLLEAWPIPINEPFLANLAPKCKSVEPRPSVLISPPPPSSPSSLINNARINFAIRSRYPKTWSTCFGTKFPLISGDIQVAPRVLNFESANLLPSPFPCLCPFCWTVEGQLLLRDTAIFPLFLRN